MQQKQIKILIAGIVVVGVFAILLNLGIKIYNKDQAAQLEKESLAQWKEQALHEYIRKVDQRLQKLEWEQMVMQGDLAGLKGDQSSTMPSSIPQSNSNATDSSDQVRHYFQNCKEENFSKIKKGMAQSDVRALCGGQEYPAFETVRNGFCFALNDARSSFYTFEGWMPNMTINYDFFVSNTDELLYVRYDHQGLAQVIEQFPITKDKKLSGQEAGVEIKQIGSNTLQMTVAPH